MKDAIPYVILACWTFVNIIVAISYYSKEKPNIIQKSKEDVDIPRSYAPIRDEDRVMSGFIDSEFDLNEDADADNYRV